MIETPCYYLFVYGSLRKGFNSPAYGYISQYFDLVEEGTVQGKLYDKGTYAAGVPSEEGCLIKGELYVIRHADEFGWAIAQLDDYEGISDSYDEKAEYYRSMVTVQMNSGESIPAWIYWYSGQTDGHPLVASGDILDYLRERFPS